MVRGIRDKSPCDAEERKKYYARRAKNNESARKHRDRTREKAEGYDKFKELYEKAKAELEQTKKLNEELKKENLMFRNVFLTPENIQSLQRSHCGACRNTRPENHPSAHAEANYSQFAHSRIANTPCILPELNHTSGQLIHGMQPLFNSPYRTLLEENPKKSQQPTTLLMLNRLRTINMRITGSHRMTMFPYLPR